MTNFNKTNIEMKADIPTEDAGYYMRLKARSMFVAALSGGCALLLGAVALLIEVISKL